MIEVQALHATNIVFFKEASFKFEPGLTFVKGRNKQRRGAGASNGAGKSLFFGILPNLIHDSHPVITKNSRSVQKQLYGKGSRAAVDFKSHAGHNYTYAKAGSKTELFKGKKNLKSRMARDTMHKLIDISEEEFYSTVYIDSSRMNNFQRGTSSDRFQFITNLFRLHDMEALRKQFRRELSDLKSDASIYERVKEDLKHAQQQLADLPEDAEREADELSRKMRKANDGINNASAELLKHETYSKYQSKIKELDAVKLPKLSYKELKRALRDLQEYAAALKEYKRQTQQLQELQEELDGLKIKRRDQDAYAEMLDMRAKVQSMEADDEPPQKPEKPELDKETALKRSKDYPTQKVLRLRDLNKGLVKQAAEALEEFDRALSHETECPTCYSGLSDAVKKQVRTTLKQRLNEAEQKLDKYNRILEACRARDQWSEYDKEHDRYIQYRKFKDKIKDFPFKDIERAEKLRERISDIKPEKPAAPEHVDQDKIEADLQTWDKHDRLKQLTADLKTEAPTMSVEEAKIRKKELSAKVSKYMERLPRLQSQAELRKQAKARVNSLQKEIDELESRLSDLPVYEMLADAYSSSGLKLLLVKRIAAALEANMNRYSKQVFEEDFQFKLDVDDNRFDIWVVRNNPNKKQVPSDVRHMSGAESKLFVFVQLMSLLPLVPSNRRMNLMVLDEPSANCDPETLIVIRDIIFPLLMTVVPCLVVISPDPALCPQHARVKTIVKDKGVSVIIDGEAP